MATKWELRGNKLVEELKDVTDPTTIESLAKMVMQEIINSYLNANSRRNPLSDVRKVVLKAFPDTKKQTIDYQYFTNSGKGNIPRYQHLALKFLTLPKEDWDAVGDDARKEYLENKETETMLLTTIEPTEHLESTVLLEPIKETIKLSDMQIEQLELDAVTQESVLNALENSGKSLAEFIQQACKVYANTINGRAKVDTDLSTVPTSELLDTENTQYKTHPKKIEELTKRAIKAIMTHNDKCTETDQKWFLSATAINGLTGSRVQSVKEVMKDYEEMIKTHNDKHGLTAYTNRGIAKHREIHLEIPMASLVPDGIDL